MRAVTDKFLIDGKPMLVPDEEVSMSYSDMESDASGRDEGGYLHRQVLRRKVPTWSFTYAFLTEEEKQYMEGLFGDADTFPFTHPDRRNAAESVTTNCYRAEYGISWKNARTGLWRNLTFDITAC